MVALNCPNNPTGAVLNADTVMAATAGVAADATLFNDATYGPLVYGQQPTSLLDSAVTRNAELPVLELHSLAKLFALGPLSTSFLVGTGSLVERLRQYSDFSWSPLSALHLRVAALCWRESRYLEEVRGDLEARLDRLRATLIEVGLEPYSTPAGIYVLTRTPERIGKHRPDTAQQAADVLLDDFGIAVASWDMPPNRYLRFTALCRPEDLEALANLKSELQLS
jgi:aspartate/methionine/tyrosine aminotransferase